jgi:hypothetical protein
MTGEEEEQARSIVSIEHRDTSKKQHHVGGKQHVSRRPVIGTDAIYG